MRTNAERLLLEALRAAARGAQVDWQTVSDVDWSALLELATAHKVLPLAVQAAYACPAAAQWDGFAQVKRLSRMQVAGQTLRTAEFRELWGFLEPRTERANSSGTDGSAMRLICAPPPLSGSRSVTATQRALKA